MATTKSLLKKTVPTIEGLKHEIDLIRYQIEMLTTPNVKERNPELVKYLFPHISYSLFPGRKLVRITGESFSIPGLFTNPPIFQHAKTYVQFRHIGGDWFFYPDGVMDSKIDNNGNFSIDVSYDGKGTDLTFAIKIIAVDIKTGRSSNEIVLFFN